MPSKKNIQALADLKDKLSGAKAIVFADYLGLSVSQMNDLRQKIKETAGELTVTKNTLLKLIYKKTLGDRLDDVLQGPTAVLIAREDEVGPLKALVEYAKDNELPKVKAGVLDDRVLSSEEINDLAKLPSRLELQAKLIGTLQGPIASLTRVLSGNTRKLIYVLKAISDQKSKGGEQND